MKDKISAVDPLDVSDWDKTQQVIAKIRTGDKVDRNNNSSHLADDSLDPGMLIEVPLGNHEK